MNAAAAPLESRDLHVAFGRNRVLEGVDLTFGAGFNGLIEQNAQVLDISDRTYVFRTGNNDISGPSAELRGSHDLVRSYLGT